jgi:hypothetical protein
LEDYNVEFATMALDVLDWCKSGDFIYDDDDNLILRRGKRMVLDKEFVGKKEFELFEPHKKKDHVQFLIDRTMDCDDVADILAFRDDQTYKWYAKVIGGHDPFSSEPLNEIMLETRNGYDSESEALFMVTMMFHGKLSEDNQTLH